MKEFLLSAGWMKQFFAS